MGERIAYVSYFASFLLDKIKNLDNIERIVLFGSVARGEDDESSDIDLFIELKKKGKKTDFEIERLLKDFYKSKDALLFRNKGVDNSINISSGRLENWGNLVDSVEGNGIVLYGKYVPTNVRGKKYVVFSWDGVGKNRGAFLNKLYGFKVKQKRYMGLVEKLGGRKLGKSTIMIPIEKKDELFDLIKKYKVDAKMFEIWA